MDYERYHFSKKELVQHTVVYFGILLGVSWLFYHSFWAALIFSPGLRFFLKGRKAAVIKSRKNQLLVEFLTGIRAVANALNAGYSVENAMEEAWKESRKVYGEEGLFTQEIGEMVRKVSLNETLESLWADLGRRSHLEDLENFAEIFSVARRSGGDLNEIIRNTAENIAKKAEVYQEIEVSLASKKMEQKIMCVIPFFILLYVDLGSPEFLEKLYHNELGVFIMTGCLCIYAAAFWWGRRIVEIEV